jgi:spore germination cell wall hydrolase CwlJ-like protein
MRELHTNLGFKLVLFLILILASSFIGLIVNSKANAVESEVGCLTEAIYFEARSEPFIGQLAVANVIMERVRDSRFPATVCGVVHAGRYWEGAPVRNRCAFSYWCDGKPETMKDRHAYQMASDVARMAIDGVLYEEVQGATFYHASYVSPYWIEKLEFITRIGKHLFYFYSGD